MTAVPATPAPPIPPRRPWLVAGCPVLLTLFWGAAADAQDAGVRIAGMTATLGATDIDAAALVTGAPARVVFEMVPTNVTPVPAPTRVEATRRTARPEAVAAFGATVAQWVARLPAPTRFGSFRGRVIGYDAHGTEVARSEADWARPFSARVRVTPVAPALDVSAGPADAVLRIDVGGADAIDAIAVQTTVHASAELGFGSLPYEAAQDVRTHGPTFPPIPVRLSRLGATSFELRFSVPVATPARTLAIDRVYLRSRTGHTAEETLPSDGAVVRVTSAHPRPAALDVRVNRERQDLVVTFRYQGPVIGRARSLYGFPMPNVEARVRDTIRLVSGRCVPAENLRGDPPWGGEEMRCRLRTTTRGGHPLLPSARLSIVVGRQPIGEAALSDVLTP